jgi:two-component system CheB/CheR fusion protein
MALILMRQGEPGRDDPFMQNLQARSGLTVRRALDGMPIEPGFLYVVGAGSDLVVGSGMFRASPARPGADLQSTFDRILNALARDYGSRCIGLALSGQGADGCSGLRAVKAGGGLVIAHDEGQGAVDATSGHAVKIGAVHLVLPAQHIAQALIDRDALNLAVQDPPGALGTERNWLVDVVDLLRAKAPHEVWIKLGSLFQEPGAEDRLVALASGQSDHAGRPGAEGVDFRNVLHSTDLATLFLDNDLNIRFFTPATKSLFRIIPGDVGRPLTDLHALAPDVHLQSDVRHVLENLRPMDRELETADGAWFVRRILPYRADTSHLEGVVVTYVDITQTKRAAARAAEARRVTELADAAKSRVLAAASHDLRQPLQTLTLLQILLEKAAQGEKAKKLVQRLDAVLGAMSGMVNVLLDINQIEAGALPVEKRDFPLNDLLSVLREDFAFQALAAGLTLTIMPCDLSVHGDRSLLEQMLRTLLANSFKYTRRGKVLVGCRRDQGQVRIEVWDTGVGIAQRDLATLFDGPRPPSTAGPGRSRGVGLSVVRRLGDLLGYRIGVRSQPGRGSVFWIGAIAVTPGSQWRPAAQTGAIKPLADTSRGRRTGAILIVEDDPDLRDVMAILLRDEGHQVMVAANGAAALGLVAQGVIDPDLVLADYSLPDGMDGLQLMVNVRDRLGRSVPGIVLTGDISIGTHREVVAQQHLHLNKPVKPKDLIEAIQQMLPAQDRPFARATGQRPVPRTVELARPMIFLVDRDEAARATIRDMLEGNGWAVKSFADGDAFLKTYQPGQGVCLVIEADLPDISGLAVMRRLQDSGDRTPAIMIAASGEVSMAVTAMKAGASDFIEKPVALGQLLTSIDRAVGRVRSEGGRDGAPGRLAGLTARQHQILELVLAGYASKNIAADLGISQRTVENHRAAIMKRSGARSLPALARMALTASWGPPKA